MKKEKKQRVQKTVEIIVSGLLTSSMLASSCSTPYMNDDLYERYVPTSDIGDELLPVSLILKPEDAKYIMALQRLSQDIL